MTISGIATNFISQLGNNGSSIVPLATKDIIKNQLTVYTFYKNGGAHDAAEKMVEENGTSVIWLAGIPVIKKLIDKTVYKKAKMSPDVDIKKLKKGAADSIEYSLEKLKNSKKPLSKTLNNQMKILEKVQGNKKLAKGLFIGKFAAATAITMAALGGLIVFKQKQTENNIKKEVKAKFEKRLALHNAVKNSEVCNIFENTKTTGKNKKPSVSFTGNIANVLSNFMYNPLWNQSILDGGITTMRTAEARDGERSEVFLKEIFEIAFIYLLAPPIQSGLEKIGEVLGKPIGLNFNTMCSKTLKESLKDKTLKEAVKNLGNIDKMPDRKLLDFIYDNPDNPVVKLLKESGDVKTIKETIGKRFGLFNIKKATEDIDALACINTKDVKATIKEISKIVESTADKGIKNITRNLNITKGIKAAAILANIGIGIWATGVLVPMLTIKKRKMQTGGNENPAIKKIEAEMQNQFTFQGLK